MIGKTRPPFQRKNNQSNREIQKAGSKNNSMFDVKDIVVDRKLKSDFIGYDQFNAESKCKKLFNLEVREVNLNL